MTDSIDDIVSDELTVAYAAKNIAPYLQVTAPEEPPEWKQITRRWNIREAVLETVFEIVEKLDSAYLFLFDHNKWKETKEYKKEEKKRCKADELMRAKDKTEHEEYLKSVTQQEVDASIVAYYASLAMSRCINHSDDLAPVSANKNLVEIIKTRRNCGDPLEIRITPELFEYCLRVSIKDGIVCLKENYWVPINGVPMPEIVNPDFEDKAVEWLKNEVYARTSKGKECILLENVAVRTEQDGRIDLKLLKYIRFLKPDQYVSVSNKE